MKEKWLGSLSFRFMSILLLAFCVMFIAVGAVALQTTASLQKNAQEGVEFTAKEISASLDNIFSNVQIVSEIYADEPRLTEFLDQTFDDSEQIEKAYGISDINGRIFSGLTRFRETNQISAVYNVVTGELFNFLDPNRDSPRVVAALEDLGVGDGDKLSQYYWYPLRANFLKTDPYNDPRLDNVIIGSRRIFSIYQGSYPYIQIFALQERQLYEKYEQLATQIGGDVYILDAGGALLSSSRLEAVQALGAPEELVDAVLARQGDSFEFTLEGTESIVSVCESAFTSGQAPNGAWLTVLVVPKNAATQAVRGLYFAMFVVLILCLAISLVILYFLYQKFMNPISKLNNAMREVDHGRLDVFLPEDGQRDEASAMLRRYNRMLASINRTLDEKLALEEVKKDLDMQVLTAQINPHFLYNTLETIVWKAEESGRPDIAELAGALGDLYRLTIAYDTVLVPLSHEIDHVLSYIEIQRARYKDAFSFDLQFNPEEAGDVLVPKIILQPLVENVFMHAMSKTAQMVSCRLSVVRKDSHLAITVLDNGPGMAREDLKRVREALASPPQIPKGKRSRGIGLYNIQTRLNIYLKNDSSIQIFSKQGYGTKVHLHIPLQTGGKEDGGEA